MNILKMKSLIKNVFSARNANKPLYNNYEHNFMRNHSYRHLTVRKPNALFAKQIIKV